MPRSRARKAKETSALLDDKSGIEWVLVHESEQAKKSEFDFQEAFIPMSKLCSGDENTQLKVYLTNSSLSSMGLCSSGMTPIKEKCI